MRTAFEHEGDIRGIDILAALVGLWREGASGSLQFSRPGATAGFEIAGGELLASSSSDPRFETAAILVRAGKLDARTLERIAAPEGADRGLLALQAGVLTRREWRWGEKIRGVEILSDLLTWLEGQYWFLRRSAEERDNGEARLAIPRLILELFLRSRDRSLIVKHLGGADVPLARAPHFDAEFATFGLTADAESVVRLIDGRSSAEEIAREAPAEAFAVEKLLAALVTLGLIHPEFAGEASLAPRPAAAPVAAGLETEVVAEAEPEEAVPPSEEPVDAEIDERVTDAEFEATELPDDEEEIVEAGDPSEDAISPGEGPTELEGEPDWEDGGPSAETDASLAVSGEPTLHPEIGPDLESVSLARPTGLREAAGLGEFEDAGAAADEGAAPLLDATPAEAGAAERPGRRPVSPLLWVLAGLLLTVGLVLVFRTRSASGPEVSAAVAVPTALAETTVAPAPTSVPAAEPSPAAPPPTAVPTSAPVAPTAAPRPRPASPAAGTAPRAAPPPAAASSGRETARQYWTDRATHDAQRLSADRKTRYAVQLELACEVPSLVEAFQHDRGGNMWVMATPFQGRTCFRVLWGRYPSIEAAKRGLGGAPRFFSTSKNRPAVTGVR